MKRHAMSGLAAACFCGPVFAQTYAVRILEPIPGRGHDASSLNAVDSAGHAVGSSYSTTSQSVGLALFMAPGQDSIMTGVLADCLPYGGSGWGGISPGGVMVGSESASCGGFSRGMVANTQTPTAITNFDPLAGGGDCATYDANDAGDIVGFSNTTSGCQPNLCIVRTAVPLRWHDGVPFAMQIPEGDISARAFGVNVAGEAVGFGYRRAFERYDATDALYWSPSNHVTVLPTLGGDFAAAYKISDAGVVVGQAQLSGNINRAVRWVGGVPQNLGVLPGDACSVAYDLDEVHGIVGASSPTCDLPGKAVLFQGGQLLDLNTRVVGISGLTLEYASNINANGWITANGKLDGTPRGALLVPCEQTLEASPVSQVVALGGAAIIHGQVNTPATTLRWNFRGVPLVDGLQADGSVVAGASTPTLSITGLTPESAGAYVLAGTNACGPVQSQPALIIFCAADFNADGFVDVYDFTDFVTCFETGVCPPGTSADFNGDGFADIFDFTDFVSSFEGAC